MRQHGGVGVRKPGPHLGDKGALFFVLADQSVISCKCIAGSWARRVVAACRGDVEQVEKFRAALEQIAALEDMRGYQGSEVSVALASQIAKTALKEFG